MKLRWKPIIIGVVIALVCFGAWRAAEGFNWLFDSLQTQVADVRQIADDAATAVSADWNPAALTPFAKPNFLAGLPQDGTVWANYKALGPRKALEPCTIGNLNITNGQGVATATCKASFEKGTASLVLGFDNLTGAWKISSLQLLL